MAVSSYPPFPFEELPTELRVIIWDHALVDVGFTSPCVHVLGNGYRAPSYTAYSPESNTHLDRAAHLNPLMRVNREARDHCLSGGRVLVDLLGSLRKDWTSPPVIVNWHQDVVYLDSTFKQQLPDFTPCCSWVSSVRQLVVSRWHLCSDIDLATSLQRMTSLRELTIRLFDPRKEDWVQVLAYRTALSAGCAPASPRDGLSSVDCLAGMFVDRVLENDLDLHLTNATRSVGVRYALDFGRDEARNGNDIPRYKRVNSAALEDFASSVMVGDKMPEHDKLALGMLTTCPSFDTFESFEEWREACSTYLRAC